MVVCWPNQGRGLVGLVLEDGGEGLPCIVLHHTQNLEDKRFLLLFLMNNISCIVELQYLIFLDRILEIDLAQVS